jgi:hypothetical protein
MDDLKSVTVSYLRDLARKHLGPGHSKLSKTELIAALAKFVPALKKVAESVGIAVPGRATLPARNAKAPAKPSREARGAEKKPERKQQSEQKVPEKKREPKRKKEPEGTKVAEKKNPEGKKGAQKKGAEAKKAAEPKKAAAPEPKKAAAPEPKKAAVPEAKKAAEKKAAAPEPKKAAAPEPKKAAAPEPKKAAAPEPKAAEQEAKKAAAPEPKKATQAPEPKAAAPEPKKATAPEPKKAAAPEEPKKAAAPEPGKAAPSEPKATAPEPKAAAPEPKKAASAKTMTAAQPEPKAAATEVKAPAQPEPKAAAQAEPKAAPPPAQKATPPPEAKAAPPLAQKTTSPAEPKVAAPEPKKAAAPEPKAAAPEPKKATVTPEPKAAAPEPKKASPEPKATVQPEPKAAAPAPEPKAAAPKDRKPASGRSASAKAEELAQSLRPAQVVTFPPRPRSYRSAEDSWNEDAADTSAERAESAAQPPAEPLLEGFFVARIVGERGLRRHHLTEDSAPRAVTSNATGYEENLGELPVDYESDVAMALARDPHTLFVSWDFTPATRARAMEGLDSPRPILRVYEGDKLVRVEDFVLEARSFYIHGLPPGRSYRVEAHFVGSDGRSRRIGPSTHPVTLPQAGLSQDTSVRFMRMPAPPPPTVRVVAQQPLVAPPEPVHEAVVDESEFITWNRVPLPSSMDVAEVIESRRERTQRQQPAAPTWPAHLEVTSGPLGSSDLVPGARRPTWPAHLEVTSGPLGSSDLVPGAPRPTRPVHLDITSGPLGSSELAAARGLRPGVVTDLSETASHSRGGSSEQIHWTPPPSGRGR